LADVEVNWPVLSLLPDFDLVQNQNEKTGHLRLDLIQHWWLNWHPWCGFCGHWEV